MSPPPCPARIVCDSVEFCPLGCSLFGEWVSRVAQGWEGLDAAFQTEVKWVG